MQVRLGADARQRRRDLGVERGARQQLRRERVEVDGDAERRARAVLEARDALGRDLLGDDVDGRPAGVVEELADVELCFVLF